ncbi:PadR family transcriptional regulator [Planomonospora sp. ID91781]|uniref:PadR family transcriptional regulator n=1 Tax=Planomonospora TaxID=1998 RepID=UPI00166F7E52|nr:MULTISPECIES: PadR family transcriptional regulator [Planomonospora]MBG0825334.1 PadR family transcriptional regulator [Planomonospora sp. ID91781]GGL39190.1 PadR family transcriptional regulator [Planomonospora parontospora subsp. antibiotica]GII18173.1 PadR family transcriptional regulator [Planomonospora parontospora subsp. antibiotica]
MASGDLTLSILGLLGEGPKHGYELKGRIHQLSGHLRPVSDGALYPAIARLEKAGLLERHEEEGEAAARRQVLSLTDAGRAELLRRLREPDGLDISDQTRFFGLLTFLSQLPDRADQARVLRRRLDFLQTPASFFYADGRPQRAEEVSDPFHRGMLLIARATGTAEKQWLREAIAALES